MVDVGDNTEVPDVRLIHKYQNSIREMSYYQCLTINISFATIDFRRITV